MGKKYKYVESEMIRVMVGIMATGKGPFTKMMLVEPLSVVYPARSTHELKNEISTAILTDKYCNQRFKVAKPGYWDLNDKIDNDTETGDRAANT